MRAGVDSLIPNASMYGIRNMNVVTYIGVVEKGSRMVNVATGVTRQIAYVWAMTEGGQLHQLLEGSVFGNYTYGYPPQSW